MYKYKNIIAIILIVLCAVLMLSDIDESNNNLTYILYIFSIKILGLLLGTLGVNLLTKKDIDNDN